MLPYPFCIYTFRSGDIVMDVSVGDKIVMKKSHPCGCHEFSVLRVGMDFKIKCNGCGHEVMLPRTKAEKNIKQLIKDNKDV